MLRRGGTYSVELTQTNIVWACSPLKYVWYLAFLDCSSVSFTKALETHKYRGSDH
jgi:hypothetical protein